MSETGGWAGRKTGADGRQEDLRQAEQQGSVQGHAGWGCCGQQPLNWMQPQPSPRQQLSSATLVARAQAAVGAAAAAGREVAVRLAGHKPPFHRPLGSPAQSQRGHPAAHNRAGSL